MIFSLLSGIVFLISHDQAVVFHHSYSIIIGALTIDPKCHFNTEVKLSALVCVEDFLYFVVSLIILKSIMYPTALN